MINKINKAIALLLVVSSFLLAIPTAMADTAETLGELKAEYQAKLDEQAKNEQMTEEAKAQIARNEALIDDAEQKIHEAEGEMEVAQQNIDASNERIAGLTEEANNVLLYLQQMQSQNAYVEYVSGATTITEMITRIAAVEQISDHIQTTMKNLEEEIKRNEELKVELTEKQEKLEQQVASYQATIAEYYDDIDEYDSYAQKIDDRVEQAKEDYESNRKICIQNLGEDNVNDNTLLSSCSSVPVSGGWSRPLQSGVITSLIGSRWGRYHNALDLGGNAEGTPVYAAAAGTVVATYYRQPCGGNEVFIYSYVNGEYYTHFYYHLLSYTVSVGDTVDQNTVIGYVGGGRQTSSAYGGYDTCTTGAHLHYGITEGRRTSHTTNVLTSIPGFSNYVGFRWSSRVI